MPSFLSLRGTALQGGCLWPLWALVNHLRCSWEAGVPLKSVLPLPVWEPEPPHPQQALAGLSLCGGAGGVGVWGGGGRVHAAPAQQQRAGRGAFGVHWPPAHSHFLSPSTACPGLLPPPSVEAGWVKKWAGYEVAGWLPCPWPRDQGPYQEAAAGGAGPHLVLCRGRRPGQMQRCRPRTESKLVLPRSLGQA